MKKFKNNFFEINPNDEDSKFLTNKISDTFDLSINIYKIDSYNLGITYSNIDNLNMFYNPLL